MSGTYEGHRAYRFEDCVLDVDRGSLFRDGSELKLRPKSFDVLRYLVEHGGTLVTRDDLLDAVWSGSVVTEDAVTQCLVDIRRAIDDTSQDKIRTVPRRGYIFDIPVTVVDGDGTATAPPAGRPGSAAGKLLLVAAGIIGIALAGWFFLPREADEPVPVEAADLETKPSIAVLPFSVLTPDEDQAYLADGISEEILNLLARQQNLRVIARTSSFSFRGRNLDVATIAGQLGVEYVLEGSVRKGGDTIRINVQLVDAGTEEYIWTETFDRALSAANLFAIQSEIALAVADSLQAELSPFERELIANVPTENMDALEAYFRGRQFLESRDPADIDRAIELFLQATSLDSNFALGYVALADAYRLQANYGSLPDKRADELGQAAIERALAIDDRLGEAYASLANLHRRREDLSAAEAAFRRGIELAPSYAPLYQWYGEFLALQAYRPDEALRYSQIAVALDPRSAIIAADHAESLEALGRFDDALAQYDAALKIDPDFGVAWMNKGIVLHWFKGRIADAVPMFVKASELNPESPLIPAYLAYAYMDMLDLEAAATFAGQAVELAPETGWSMQSAWLLRVAQSDYPAATPMANELLSEWPGYARPMQYLRDRYIAEGDYDGALELYQRYYPALFSEAPPRLDAGNVEAAIGLSYLLIQVGRLDRAQELLQAGLAEFGDRPERIRVQYALTDVKAYAILGDKSAALRTLRATIDSGWRIRWWYDFYHDDALDLLHDEPEFREIEQAIRAKVEAERQAVDSG